MSVDHLGLEVVRRIDQELHLADLLHDVRLDGDGLLRGLWRPHFGG